MKKFYFPDFNIDITLCGGQAFNWIKIDDSYFGVFTDHVLKVKYQNNFLFWESSKNISEETVKTYFDYELDYRKVIDEITKDENIKKIIDTHFGLRILRQDFWQTLVSFVISQNNNIPKIKFSIQKLSQLNNRKIYFDGKTFYAFPTINELSKFTEEELKLCSLGYRAKYIYLICKELIKNKNFAKTTHTITEMRNLLLKLYGIGDKVADCILVFGYNARNITPIDLWAKRAIIFSYNLEESLNYKQIQEFISSKFQENTAYAGQFLFESFRVFKKTSV